MSFARMRVALNALICALLLATPGPLGLTTPAFAQTPGYGHARGSALPPTAQEKEESCGRGKATTDFGWRVVGFGVDTLKYLIGLFIIPIGLFLVVVGWLLQMVEAVVC
ncbi:hypothetical protein [Chenggangzhangella methanolivorans]|uniref:Uncharacterized protein n=1 Tax=Chenggangzhangella methanolivorans TaxID=1437009 RepID=A0A9E6RH38_9HYPH|nr:hypothetical protein [Chenggangzhangella methanolivorans]QZO01341.1 hypothetical protein K6K41_07655 [Chenggangzhangella methanolivorans]